MRNNNKTYKYNINNYRNMNKNIGVPLCFLPWVKERNKKGQEKKEEEGREKDLCLISIGKR